MVISSSKKQNYNEGDLRLSSKFLWWPCTIKSDVGEFETKITIWFETIWILEKYGYEIDYINNTSNRIYKFIMQEIIKPIPDRDTTQLNLMLGGSWEDHKLAMGIINSYKYLNLINK